MAIVKEYSVIEEKVNTEKEYLLILWNDNINDQMYVALSLCEILVLDFVEGWKLMLLAHTKSNTVIFSNSLDQVIVKHNKFSDLNITTTIEKI